MPLPLPLPHPVPDPDPLLPYPQPGFPGFPGFPVAVQMTLEVTIVEVTGEVITQVEYERPGTTVVPTTADEVVI